VYPHSCVWNVIQPGTMAEKLSELLYMDSTNRAAVAELLMDHAQTFCGDEAVQKALSAATSELNA